MEKYILKSNASAEREKYRRLQATCLFENIFSLRPWTQQRETGKLWLVFHPCELPSLPLAGTQLPQEGRE